MTAPNTNTRRVMTERHHGWEGASPGLLARVFDTTPQAVTAIVSKGCAGCGRFVCGCSDSVYAGIVPAGAMLIVIDPLGAILRDKCPQCNGTGLDEGNHVTGEIECPSCEGEGAA